jgi:hypothetical protein
MIVMVVVMTMTTMMKTTAFVQILFDPKIFNPPRALGFEFRNFQYY